MHSLDDPVVLTLVRQGGGTAARGEVPLPPPRAVPPVHPLAEAMRWRGMLASGAAVRDATRLLARYASRCRRWDGIRAQSPLLRPATSIRVVNTFVDGTRPVYTVWAYDVLSGREWYAPVRYLDDFADLR